MMLNGITVILWEKTLEGTDQLGAPKYTEQKVKVKNVLVAPATVTDLPTNTDLTGKKALYTLAIPKGDNHNWRDAKIEFFGQTWQSVGFVQEGIEELVPTAWHKKVTVEQYGQ